MHTKINVSIKLQYAARKVLYKVQIKNEGGFGYWMCQQMTQSILNVSILCDNKGSSHLYYIQFAHVTTVKRHKSIWYQNQTAIRYVIYFEFL